MIIKLKIIICLVFFGGCVYSSNSTCIKDHSCPVSKDHGPCPFCETK